MPTYNTSVSIQDTDGNSSATVALTAGAGSRRFLEVYVPVSAGSIAAHSGVTWGGVALTQRGSAVDNGANGRMTHWYLLEADFPGGATGNVVATCAASQDTIGVFAIISNDVNQSNPFENASQTTATGTDNSASLTVTSTATASITNAVCGVNGSSEDIGINIGTGTSRQELETAADYVTFALGTAAGASPNVTPSWTFTMSGGDTMSTWGMIGDALKDDPGGGGGGNPWYYYAQQ